METKVAISLYILMHSDDILRRVDSDIVVS